MATLTKIVDEKGGNYAKVNSDGSQLVSLLGSTIAVPVDVQYHDLKSVIIKEWSAQIEALTANCNYGETKGSTTSITPLDVSKYTQKMVFVKNNYDTAIYVAMYARDKVVSGSTKIADIIPQETLAAGESKLFTVADYPKINLPYIATWVSISRLSNPTPTTGSITILFYGSVF